ncbi:phosphatase PAP2 family protein [Lacticaseibacillus jixiensis]|uniref:phosphatase PAP2 family protein n=1 Tax=Lacticaseibacillus jixiensis TaxID=3231926 RepID=UPI0036F1C524
MKTKIQQSLGLGLLVMFLALALSVHTQAPWLHTFDAAFSRLASKAVTAPNTVLFKVIGTLASPALVLGLTALLCGWLWHRRDLCLAVWIGGVQLIGSTLAEGFKQLVARLRPLHQLVADSGYSFPSGHTFCTVLLVASLLMLGLPLLDNQELQLVAVLLGIVWTSLVAISRVYLRDHYASDVLGSVLLALGYWLVITPYATAVQTGLRRMIPERIQSL